MWDMVDLVSDTIRVVLRPRFYVPLIAGAMIALALERLMSEGGIRTILQVASLLVGLAVGYVWERSAE